MELTPEQRQRLVSRMAELVAWTQEMADRLEVVERLTAHRGSSSGGHRQ